MKKIFIISLAALALAACARETDNGGDREVGLQIMPRLASSASVEVTRARQDGDFTVGTRVGLSIESADITMPVKYNNFYGLSNGKIDNKDSWSYYIDGLNYGTYLAGFKSWRNITVMGYFPYNEEVTDVEHIPFSLAQEDTLIPGTASTTKDKVISDHMVATTATKDMEETPSGGLVTLNYEHIMTSIDFNIYKTYQGPQVMLEKIRFEVDGTREFVINGTYTALNNGTVDVATAYNNDGESVQTLDVEYNFTLPTSSPSVATRPMIIMPPLEHDGTLGFEDATVTMTFFFVDANGDPFDFEDSADPQPKLSFNLSAVNNGTTGAPVYGGLRPGYKYTVSAYVGTYVRFEGLPIVNADEDMDTTTPPEHIEI